MSNPIFSSPIGQTQQNFSQTNSTKDLIQQVKKSSNPQQTIERMLINSPNFQKIMNYISQNGGDAKTAFYNMAAQKGIDPDSILKTLR
jgi:hypothetical protein